VTGISRREFRPNLQRIKITTPNGTNKTVLICTRCLEKESSAKPSSRPRSSCR
jgi:large subunit ribosomal protein L28